MACHCASLAGASSPARLCPFGQPRQAVAPKPLLSKQHRIRITRNQSLAPRAHVQEEAEKTRTASVPCSPDSRRHLLIAAPAVALASALALGPAQGGAALAQAAATQDATQFTDMPALRGKDYGKTRMKYPDYTESASGLQYKDLKEGTGPIPKAGDTVVIDWDGFTIGYYGRIFEARNKAKGGSFEGNEKDFFRFRLGSGQVIPAFEEALATMHVGAIRRIIVPPELGYPNNDFNQKGPKPITFSGQRALDFVLKNQGLIDKTLLFDIELLRIVPA